MTALHPFLPYLATGLAILSLSFLAHAANDARRKLSFQIAMTGLCWSFAAVLAAVLS